MQGTARREHDDSSHNDEGDVLRGDAVDLGRVDGPDNGGDHREEKDCLRQEGSPRLLRRRTNTTAATMRRTFNPDGKPPWSEATVEMTSALIGRSKHEGDAEPGQRELQEQSPTRGLRVLHEERDDDQHGDEGPQRPEPPDLPSADIGLEHHGEDNDIQDPDSCGHGEFSQEVGARALEGASRNLLL